MNLEILEYRALLSGTETPKESSYLEYYTSPEHFCETVLTTAGGVAGAFTPKILNKLPKVVRAPVEEALEWCGVKTSESGLLGHFLQINTGMEVGAIVGRFCDRQIASFLSVESPAAEQATSDPVGAVEFGEIIQYKFQTTIQHSGETIWYSEELFTHSYTQKDTTIRA